MKKITAILIGAGGRGMRYTDEMCKLPEKFQVVAVAEPIDVRRQKAKARAGIPDENCFRDWQEAFSLPKMADMAIIATQDNNHYEAALKAIELGYDLLLEKPAAQTSRECIDIANAAKKKGVKVLVCHVLRYTPFYKRVKQLLTDNVIGDIVSVVAVEAVGHLHQSHSFVRGPWRDSKESTPMIIAKCCHDIDIIQWLIGKPCKKVSSFGSLSYFRPENAPKGAPKHCKNENCPAADTCVYNCEKVYGNTRDWFRGMAVRHLTSGAATDELVDEALRTTNYGACVFHAGNDVVDHQVVNMEFEGGITAGLTMNAFNAGGRFIRIFGTKGELTAYMSGTTIEVFSFADRTRHEYSVIETEEAITGGHGGGDSGIINDLYYYLNGTYQGCSVADISVSVANHLIGFAAEEARLTDTVVNIDDFDRLHGYENKYF